MSEKEKLNSNLNKIISDVYKKCFLEVSNFRMEMESKEYDACQFNLNDVKIISRNAKITPKKVGQFVTFWKREINHPIAPFDADDNFNFFVINVQKENQSGQFVFPKSILLQKGIISTLKKEGKRGFRVYPPWDIATNKQAIQSQQWQLNYFYEVNQNLDLNKVIAFYEK